MARVPFTVSAIAACMIVTASPLASATDQALQSEVPVGNLAQNVNMLSMNLCGDRAELVRELDQVFHEAPMAVGQVDQNAVVEIFVSQSGTWTILATGTDGVSCIVSAGEGFQSTVLVRGLDA